MQFFLKFFNFRLTNIWIQSFLHLLFELIFSFPQKNLPFTLNNLVHEFSFFFPNYVNVVLKLGSFVLHFFEFFNELTFEIDILVFQFRLFVRIESNVIIKFVHLLLKSFEIDSDLSNFFFVTLITVIKSFLFLFQNHLFVFKIHDILINLH